jgi:RHS repeat-associated protein
MAGLSDKAVKADYVQNKYKLNSGNELQNQEFADGTCLELYDAVHRMYDPQIGRFGQIDPMGDALYDYPPYSFASNNPLTFNDPLGL